MLEKEAKNSRNIHAGFWAAQVSDVSAADHDITLEGGIAKGVYLSTAGDLKVDTPNGDVITYPALEPGFHPIPHKKIYTAGTTVTNKTTGIISGTW